MKIDRRKRKLFGKVRVNDGYTILCFEYEWDIYYDCYKIWKIYKTLSRCQVPITMINSEDLDRVFECIEGRRDGEKENQESSTGSGEGSGTTTEASEDESGL